MVYPGYPHLAPFHLIKVPLSLFMMIPDIDWNTENITSHLWKQIQRFRSFMMTMTGQAKGRDNDDR